MELVYVIGPYRAKTDAEKWLNIARARLVAQELWREGYAVICPHLNSAWMSGICDEQQFIKAGCLMISRCDAVALGYGWEHSKGGRQELAIAKKLGKKIIDKTHVGVSKKEE